jgi:hypothetical protein
MNTVPTSSRNISDLAVEQVHRQSIPTARVRPLLCPDVRCLGAADALVNPGRKPDTNVHALHMDKIARVLKDPVKSVSSSRAGMQVVFFRV